MFGDKEGPKDFSFGINGIELDNESHPELILNVYIVVYKHNNTTFA